MADFLLELYSEELPASHQDWGRTALRDALIDALAGLGLDTKAQRKNGHMAATPRRLAVGFDNLPARLADRSEVIRGPRVDARARALAGFARKYDLAVEELDIHKTTKGEWYSVTITTPGRDLGDALTELLPSLLGSLAWPKSMRWDDTNTLWGRPLRHILCCFDGKPLAFEFAGLVAGMTTYGHAVRAQGLIEAVNFAQWRDRLKAAHVMVDADARHDFIWSKAFELATTRNCLPDITDALVSEIAGLVEKPELLLGSMDLMDLYAYVPGEIIRYAMQQQQRYIPLIEGGALSQHFIIVADHKGKDDGVTITQGNERVLRARLADARFFWRRDRERRLEDRLPDLETMTFHAQLGTMLARSQRIAALARCIAKDAEMDYLADSAEQAARLAKADLTTETVAEFPALQGIIGAQLAKADGFKPEITDAIASHYAPRSRDDGIPYSPIDRIVALADKLDTLCGFWLIGAIPTGSSDPFALRRAALGIIRILVEDRIEGKPISLPLLPLMRTAIAQYDSIHHHDTATIENLCHDLDRFIQDRLRIYLRDQGYRHDVISAILNHDVDCNPGNAAERLDELVKFLVPFPGSQLPDDLLATHRRAAHILSDEEHRDGCRYRDPFDPALFSEGAEHTLAAAISEVQKQAEEAWMDHDYLSLMKALVPLREPIDHFFDNVTVNSPDATLRANRLRLLAAAIAPADQIADFSCLEIDIAPYYHKPTASPQSPQSAPNAES